MEIIKSGTAGADKAPELTDAFIEALQTDEEKIKALIAKELLISTAQVAAVISLSQEGCTVPFIARYRKEAHNSLDEVKIRDITHSFASYTNLENRRLEIIKAIYGMGKLDTLLYDNITRARTLTELEDIYAPYKRKKKTRAMLAEERGLAALADAMLTLDDAALEVRAADFVREDTENPELSVPDAKAALEGAVDIIAARAAQDAGNRALVKKFYFETGKMTCKGVGSEEEKKSSVYLMYWDYSEPVKTIKPHRVLAIHRGEKAGKLEVSFDVDESAALEKLYARYDIHNHYHKNAIEDGFARLLSPAVVREIRSEAEENADTHSISVFSENLKNLLMQQPIKGTRVMGLDPGIRTGTKCVCLDDTGKFLFDFLIFAHKSIEAKKLLLDAINKYNIELLAIGNGTGSHDVQKLAAEVISENHLSARFTVVDEDGASVYSASDTAREEFPELDLTVRGAISIGRRLQDPLAELVKVPPQSIGVGLYQHDVNQKKLCETLDEVVSSVVNNVGVNLNTASASLLSYVSGINRLLAKKIVRFREENGKVLSRADLLKVPGMGEKTFQQCAGFLKIPESQDALDNTWVHPENYEIARIIKENITTTGNLSDAEITKLSGEYSVGTLTVKDIIGELSKPSRDPREGYPKPVLQQGVLSFEDLSVGMKVTGKIKNVVDFGAFVDLGIKESALVHISQLSDSFVRNPLDLIKAGDVLDFTIIELDAERKRIGLSRKKNPRLSLTGAAPASSTSSPATVQASGGDGTSGAGGMGGGAAKKRVVVVKKSGVKSDSAKSDGERAHDAPKSEKRQFAAKRGGDDSAFYYNPFAEAFKNMKR